MSPFYASRRIAQWNGVTSKSKRSNPGGKFECYDFRNVRNMKGSRAEVSTPNRESTFERKEYNSCHVLRYLEKKKTSVTSSSTSTKNTQSTTSTNVTPTTSLFPTQQESGMQFFSTILFYAMSCMTSFTLLSPYFSYIEFSFLPKHFFE